MKCECSESCARRSDGRLVTVVPKDRRDECLRLGMGFLPRLADTIEVNDECAERMALTEPEWVRLG